MIAVKVAPADVPVLITGANGTGKEQLAAIVQANSRRKDKPFVKVNAGALPDELLEAELFGAEAGAFSVVLEAIAEPLAERISKAVAIPTIGIGASVACDGQILVMEDMLGLSPRVPKFVKEFGKVGAAIENAIRMYADEVKARTFPGNENTYDVKD